MHVHAAAVACERARRLLKTGRLDEAESVIARLRREVEAFQQRNLWPATNRTGHSHSARNELQ